MMTKRNILSSFLFSTFPQILCGLWGHCLMVREQKYILFINNNNVVIQATFLERNFSFLSYFQFPLNNKEIKKKKEMLTAKTFPVTFCVGNSKAMIEWNDILMEIVFFLIFAGFPAAAYAAYAAGRGFSGYPSFGLPYPTGNLNNIASLQQHLTNNLCNNHIHTINNHSVHPLLQSCYPHLHHPLDHLNIFSTATHLPLRL